MYAWNGRKSVTWHSCRGLVSTSQTTISSQPAVTLLCRGEHRAGWHVNCADSSKKVGTLTLKKKNIKSRISYSSYTDMGCYSFAFSWYWHLDYMYHDHIAFIPRRTFTATFDTVNFVNARYLD